MSENGSQQLLVVVVVVSSPHESPRCGVRRVEKVWTFWLPTMSVGNPAAKRQLPFRSVTASHQNMSGGAEYRLEMSEKAQYTCHIELEKN